MPNPKSLPEGPITPIPELLSASTFNFDYLLHKGKIYLRTRTPEDPKSMVRGDLVSLQGEPDALEWKLFDGIGVPYNEKMETLLAKDEHIVEIAVASEIVVAVSNFDHVFLYKPTEFDRPIHWEEYVGAPDFVRRKLSLPAARIGWAFSCSVRTKPEVRTTEFMHPKEIVGFFSDGNLEKINFDYGFTPTIYVLVEDGTRIHFWDTGLAPSFSRGFLVPEGTRGLFISAAGSTVFLCAIDSENRLRFYTRMIDYEINGSCPGLKVSYTDTPVKHPPDGPKGSFFLGHGVRKMPLSGWVEHPVDEILSHITHRVCIRLTGQGDKARELRIQGNHPKKGWGYYSKKIAHHHWKFHPDKTAAPSLPAEDKALSFKTPFAEIRHTYNGAFYKRKLPHIIKRVEVSDISLELVDFHPLITDSDEVYIVFHSPEEEAQKIRIYAVDAWGLHFHKEDAELFGTVDGEPKPLIGTIVFTPEQREFAQNGHSRLAAFLKKQVLPYDGQTKAITIMADNSKVTLRFGHNRCRFKRILSEEEINDSFYIKKAMNPQLMYTPQNQEECINLIAQNKKCLKKIHSIFSERKLKSKEDTLLHMNARLVQPSILGLFKVMHFSDDPTYEQAVNDLGGLFKAHTRAAAHAVKKGKNHAPGYIRAVHHLKERIEELEEMKHQDFAKTLTL